MEPTHDFYADTYDVIDGKRVVYNSAAPDRKCEVTNLLDADGDETEDEDAAVLGVVKIADGCFTIFYLTGAK